MNIQYLKKLACGVALVFVLPFSAYAGVTFFPSMPIAFATACSNLSVGFYDSSLDAPNLTICNQPVSSTSNDACYDATNSMLSGIALTSAPYSLVYFMENFLFPFSGVQTVPLGAPFAINTEEIILTTSANALELLMVVAPVAPAINYTIDVFGKKCI